jgi:hypothetical protein
MGGRPEGCWLPAGAKADYYLIVGTEDELVKAFASAGWVHVDRSVEETVLTGVMDSIEKKDYLTMPMSTLYLFNPA